MFYLLFLPELNKKIAIFGVGSSSESIKLRGRCKGGGWTRKEDVSNSNSFERNPASPT